MVETKYEFLDYIGHTHEAIKLASAARDEE